MATAADGTNVVMLGIRRAEDAALWAGPGCETTGLGPLELALYSEGLLEYRDPQASVPVLSIGYGFTDDELKALCKPPSAYVKVRPKPQALVYDILPSTTAVFSYVTGS